jgi:hypothetical protein
MKMTDLFLAELEREAVPTRRTLERVPGGRPDWKPHPKSMPLGYLATLVAMLPSWVVFTLNQDELDLRPVGKEPYKTPDLYGDQELLTGLDKNVADAREALLKTTAEHLLTPWRLLVGGQLVMEQPRHVVLRDSVFNHLAHHRGQLTVYLRLNDAAVPAIYGPSADEGSM